MTKPIKKISRSLDNICGDEHHYEHWLVDDQVYFITARCRGQYPAMASGQAKGIFWDRLEHYTAEFGFSPWVTWLLKKSLPHGWISSAGERPFRR